jgi:rod shape-determining protein MreB
MRISKALDWFSHDLAIDLGTANSLVYSRGRGVVLSEPSVVAVKGNGNGTKHIVAVGAQAKEMLGKTPDSIATIRPMKDGVIADFDAAEFMLRYFIRKVHNGKRLARPRILICVPSGVTSVERRAVRESALAAGAGEVFLIEEPMAAAIGADLPITEPVCSVVVDIGGGTTEVAMISLAGIVHSRSVPIGGNKMDLAIQQYLRSRYGLLIGERTAEEVKIRLGNACPSSEEPLKMSIKGRDLVSGIPRSVEIDSNEVREAMSELLSGIVEAVKDALEQAPPELAADVVDRGIVIAGGGALLKRLNQLISGETGVPVFVTDDPLCTVVRGSGKALESLEMLKDVLS